MSARGRRWRDGEPERRCHRYDLWASRAAVRDTRAAESEERRAFQRFLKAEREVARGCRLDPLTRLDGLVFPW